MGQPAARVSDVAGHGGAIILGASKVRIGKLAAARLGDKLICPGADGPKPHIMGNITTASTTVKIEGAYAARMGDDTGCGVAGISGIGMPPVKGGVEGGGALFGDEKDGVGVYKYSGETTKDGMEGKVEVAGKQSEDEYKFGGDGDDLYVKGGRKSLSGKADGQVGMKDGQGMKAGAEGSVDSTYIEAGTSDGRHSVGGEGKGGTAEVLGDMLLGNDGKRTGVALGGKAEAAVASGKVGANDTWDIPFTDSNININRSGEVSGGSIGGGAGGGVYKTNDDGRYHLSGFGEIHLGIGIDINVDISIGEKPKLKASPIITKGVGVPATPGKIITGLPTVKIG